LAGPTCETNSYAANHVSLSLFIYTCHLDQFCRSTSHIPQYKQASNARLIIMHLSIPYFVVANLGCHFFIYTILAHTLILINTNELLIYSHLWKQATIEAKDQRPNHTHFPLSLLLYQFACLFFNLRYGMRLTLSFAMRYTQSHQLISLLIILSFNH
jgi:hypothetical protein